MRANEPVREQFTAVWNERHYVALVFPKTDNAEITASIREASSNVGAFKESGVHFDFDWQVLDGAVEVGRGSGRTRPASAFGSSEAQGLAFGEFQAVAGRKYQVEARPGPSFGQWSQAKPLLEVGVNSPHPSIGLAITKELDRPIALVFASFGLLFLGGAIWTSKK
jgi:hypothetical protein